MLHRRQAPPLPGPVASAAARRLLGQCYTTNHNPFRAPPFGPWARRAGLDGGTILEPFAGADRIVGMIGDAGWRPARSDSHDTSPARASVVRRDAIRSFPRGCDACTSSPPWPGRSSAPRRGLECPDTRHDGLYKHCLGLALDTART